MSVTGGSHRSNDISKCRQQSSTDIPSCPWSLNAFSHHARLDGRKQQSSLLLCSERFKFKLLDAKDPFFASNAHRALYQNTEQKCEFDAKQECLFAKLKCVDAISVFFHALKSAGSRVPTQLSAPRVLRAVCVKKRNRIGLRTRQTCFCHFHHHLNSNEKL